MSNKYIAARLAGRRSGKSFLEEVYTSALLSRDFYTIGGKLGDFRQAWIDEARELYENSQTSFHQLHIYKDICCRYNKNSVYILLDNMGLMYYTNIVLDRISSP